MQRRGDGIHLLSVLPFCLTECLRSGILICCLEKILTWVFKYWLLLVNSKIESDLFYKDLYGFFGRNIVSLWKEKARKVYQD